MKLLSAAIVLAAVAASGAAYTALAPRDGRAGAAAIEAPLSTKDRLYLTAAQTEETRNQALWPSAMRSMLNVHHKMRYGEWLWNERGVPAGPATVRVDLKTQLISVVRGGHEIGTAVILFGGENHETPLGRFPILSKDAHYRSRTYDAPMPYALRLTHDGVALHGSNVRPGHATHGCIGLPIEFAQKLFGAMAKGDKVLIVRT